MQRPGSEVVDHQHLVAFDGACLGVVCCLAAGGLPRQDVRRVQVLAEDHKLLEPVGGERVEHVDHLVPYFGARVAAGQYGGRVGSGRCDQHVPALVPDAVGDAVHHRWLKDIPWTRVAQLDPGRTAVFLLSGPLEQRCPHLPLGADLYQASERHVQ